MSEVKAQIHRFHDAVGIYIGTGQTVYLSPATAKALGSALLRCARDIRETDFQKSSFNTIEFTLADGREHKRRVKP